RAAGDDVRRRRDGDARPRPRRGGGGRSRHRPRPLAWAPAWHPLRREGPARGRGLSHDLGRRPLRQPALRRGRHRRRATQGRRSRHGAMALSWTMDKLGPMGRSAEDCALVLAAIAGKDPNDPSSVERFFRVPHPLGPSPRRGEGERGGEVRPRRKLRIGILKNADQGIQPEVAKNFRDALSVLKDVITVTENVELPDLPYGVVGGTIIAVEGARAFDDLVGSGRVGQLTAPEERIGGYAALAIPARDD